MTNPGLMRCTRSDEKTFTTNFGIRVRRILNHPLRHILRLATKRKIVVECYPSLPKGKSYIFASTHSFDEDVIANLASIDRNAWVLFGTTNQLECNRQVYAAWLNGLIYIDRLSAPSRKSATAKMERILHSGSSILMFPEGGWNNTEDLLVQQLFAGPWLLSQRTGAPVIPVAAFHEHGADTIYLRYGNPLPLGEMEKTEAITLLRDSMAAMMYEMIEAHATPIQRGQLRGDQHLRYMEERCKEYLRVPWTRDVWEEELTIYRPREIVRPDEVWAFVDNIAITLANAAILAPVLAKRERTRRYDFKAYMHRNWDKKGDNPLA